MEKTKKQPNPSRPVQPAHHWPLLSLAARRGPPVGPSPTSCRTRTWSRPWPRQTPTQPSRLSVAVLDSVCALSSPSEPETIESLHLPLPPTLAPIDEAAIIGFDRATADLPSPLEPLPFLLFLYKLDSRAPAPPFTRARPSLSSLPPPTPCSPHRPSRASSTCPDHPRS
jgi:hypothetical protein